MLKKFITIKHVGRFTNCNAPGDLELRKLTVVHADNGRGKTTLGSILRSLQTGDAAYITGRSSLGITGNPHVIIRLEGENRTYQNGAWDQPYPHLMIFDDTFIHENVYTGDYIAHEHRKNLYQVIIGSKGVQLAHDVDDLDNQIREHNKELAAKQAAVKNHTPTGLTVDQFLALPPDPAIDEKITTKQTDLRTAEKSTEIKVKPALQPLTLPTLPATLDTLLAQELQDLQKDTEQRVRDHIRKHQHAGFEQWLSQGMPYATGPDCPFCGRPLTGNQLLAAYQGYFAQSYKKLKADLLTLRATLEQSFGDAATPRLQQRITENARVMDFWLDFMTAELQEPDTAALQAAIQAVRSAALASIDQKIATPLDPLQPSAALNEARAQLAHATANITQYNNQIQTINEWIAATRNATLTANATTIKADLSRLRATKERHDEQANTACNEYATACANKKLLELKKAQAKADLDEYAKSVFDKYQERINKLLEHFGAGFRIGDVKTSYAGGAPRSAFQIVINNVPVELGDAKTPVSTPSFRNTLSAGDRRALALAFFIAQAERDPDLPKNTIVFDDPFNSLDNARRICTKEQIYNLLKVAKQVIVLSHDAYFLRLVHDAVPGGCVKALALARDGQDTTIQAWDIEAATREEYFQNYDALHQYVTKGQGEPAHVVRCIRPLLEKYLRVKYPSAFLPNEWLGDFITKIRLAPAGSVLGGAQHWLAELEAINEYSKRYHHDGDLPVAPEPLDDNQLAAHARRTLDLIANT